MEEILMKILVLVASGEGGLAAPQPPPGLSEVLCPLIPPPEWLRRIGGPSCPVTKHSPADFSRPWCFLAQGLPPAGPSVAGHGSLTSPPPTSRSPF